MTDIGYFRLMKGVLSPDAIRFLKEAAKQYLQPQDAIPSYVLLDRLQSPVVAAIEALVEREVGRKPYYLNDFYLYSDAAFGAGWHVDTELFTFEDCLNAWILLAPDAISNPLAFISQVNDGPDNYFHSLRRDGDQALFANCSNGRQHRLALADIEARRVTTPTVEVGDILLLDPKKFHKTNTTAPKHTIVIKFAFETPNGFRAANPVPSLFWPEVRLFNRLLAQSPDWTQFLEQLRAALQNPEARRDLSAGFFPEKIALYRSMVATL
ncbi:MAG TPA: hypothetical protein VM491_15350 [Burkholderiaceae bacterium]|jgi:hypothetical protein|nr:hypothetical protein [Burkholderiaceae bacterium]